MEYARASTRVDVDDVRARLAWYPSARASDATAVVAASSVTTERDRVVAILAADAVARAARRAMNIVDGVVGGGAQ